MVSVIAKMAVDDICSANLHRANAEDVKKILDITNILRACLLFAQTYPLMVYNPPSLAVCVFAIIAVDDEWCKFSKG